MNAVLLHGLYFMICFVFKFILSPRHVYINKKEILKHLNRKGTYVIQLSVAIDWSRKSVSGQRIIFL